MRLETENPWEKGNQTEDAGGKKILNMPGHLISWSASRQNLQQWQHAQSENSNSAPVVTIQLWILVNLSQLSRKSTCISKIWIESTNNPSIPTVY